MITLHILQLLSDNNFGTIEDSLFWDEMPIDKTGIGILTRGGPMARSNRAYQDFDLYSRGENDIAGADQLEKVWEFFSENEYICELPPVTEGAVKSNKLYQRVNITPQGNIENLGKDETGRKVWRSSWRLNYIKQ